VLCKHGVRGSIPLISIPIIDSVQPEKKNENSRDEEVKKKMPRRGLTRDGKATRILNATL
jgi:hypothetical protein